MEIFVHGGTGGRHLLSEESRTRPLLAELDSLFAQAHILPDPAPPGHRTLALRRGALEYCFASLQILATATGDSVRLWRVLIPLGIEPPPPGDEGALLFTGHSDWDARPYHSYRSRRHVLAIIEGR